MANNFGMSPLPKPSQVTPGAPQGNAGMAVPNPHPMDAASNLAAVKNMIHPGGFFGGGQSPTTSTPSAGPQAPGPMSGPGYGETYGQQHMGAYEQPTMFEQFAQQQMEGNNPYYDRLRQQQSDQINQQMAARGHYNSGGALAALGNADAALYAGQFQNMGNLLGQASNMQINRTQAGFNQAQGIQNLQQGRIQDQFHNASDIAHLGSGLYGGFYGQGGALSGDAAMAGINARANASQLQGQGQQAFTNSFADLLKAGAGGGGFGSLGGGGTGGDGLLPPTMF